MIQITSDMIQVMFQGGSDLRVPREIEFPYIDIVQFHFVQIRGTTLNFVCYV